MDPWASSPTDAVVLERASAVWFDPICLRPDTSLLASSTRARSLPGASSMRTATSLRFSRRNEIERGEGAWQNVVDRRARRRAIQRDAQHG